MNKIGLIIKREYLSRVRKRSFLILTIVGPLLFAALMILPYVIMNIKGDTKKILVIDETSWFENRFENNEEVTYVYMKQDLDSAKKLVVDKVFDAVLYVPLPDVSVPSKAELYSTTQISMTLTSNIENTMKKQIEYQKMLSSGINPDLVKSISADMKIVSIRFDDEGREKESFGEVQFIIGIFLAMLIYIFILGFSGQVMQGVVEEKSSRIVEVIVSSVKPFHLMMGKIIGIGLVGLTQFLLWIVLTMCIYGVFIGATGFQSLSNEAHVTEQLAEQPDISAEMAEILNIANSVNFGGILAVFLLFFLGGYILYASLMAGIGGAVDNDTDSQQFTLPLTIPLILGIVLSTYIANAPDGSIALWLSMIPFTSPVAMLVRIPYGVPYWQIALSLVLLYGTFILTTWIAAKIYRTGILIYGKKITYKELWKWLRY